LIFISKLISGEQDGIFSIYSNNILFLKNSPRSDIQTDSLSIFTPSITTKIINILASNNKISELNQSIILKNETFQLHSFCNDSKCYLLPIYLTKGIFFQLIIR
jgi:hypothetical protein